MNPVHNYPLYFSEVYFNLIVSFSIDRPRGLFPSGTHTEILYAFYIAPMRATCPVHLTLTYLMMMIMIIIIIIILVESYKLCSSSKCNVLQPSVSSSHLVPNIPLSTLFSNLISSWTEERVHN
jgi:hypothetical protein